MENLKEQKRKKIELIDKQFMPILIKKLESNPKDTSILLKLGNIYRRIGDSASALNCYKKVREIRPENRLGQYLFEVISGKDVNDYSPDKEKPAPFVQINNFLSEPELEEVWQQVYAVKEHFNVSKFHEGEIDYSKRSSNLVHKNKLSDIKKWFGDKVKNSIHNHWKRLNITPFEISKIEIQLTKHNHGDFYTVHKDEGEVGSTGDRLVTFVYYFNNVPKLYKGGDLLLYDTNFKEDSYTNNFTRIVPENNKIIFFPSKYYHEVTRVICKPNDFKNSRFTLNGWFHEK